MALEKGTVDYFPDQFADFINQVALSVKPVSPVLVCGKTEQETSCFIEPVIEFFEEPPCERLYTYAWKSPAGGDHGEQERSSLVCCPYQHDPVLLIPEKSRQEVLSEAARGAGFSYPLALESRMHCPVCLNHYKAALARSGGIWEKLVEEVAICERETASGTAPLEEQILASNRGVFTCSFRDD
jgi:uncharacterized protein YbaR (Trm112 family)